MPNARYYRAQAKLCLEIAKQISDTAGADTARRVAIENLRRAKALERDHSLSKADHRLVALSPPDSSSERRRVKRKRGRLGPRSQPTPERPF